MPVRTAHVGRGALALWVAALLLGLGGCAARHLPAPPTQKTYPAHEDGTRDASALPVPRPEGRVESEWSQEGYASWYGPKFHRRRTASGEVFDMNALSAAHPTLPFGTVIEVTNLNNGLKLRLRVNDRGPFSRDRVLDVSLAAAKELDFAAAGVAPVRIEVVSGADLTPVGNVATGRVVVGRYESWWKADRLRHLLKGRFATARIEGRDGDYQVVIGPFSSEEVRRRIVERLTREGYEVELE